MHPARSQFSPDGKYLAYFSNLKGAEHEAVWFAHADGSGAVELAHDPWRNIFPFWSPRGNNLVYEAEYAADHQFYIRRVPVAGGSPQTLYHVKRGPPQPRYCGDGNILFHQNNQLDEIAPTGKIQAAPMNFAAPAAFVYLPDSQCQSVAYGVKPRSDQDARAGIWIKRFHAPPRQAYRGWVVNLDTASRHGVYFITGSPDMNGALWKVNWDGSGLTRLRGHIPLIYSINYQHSDFLAYFDVSPDGKKVAFPIDRMLSENIGMLEWGKKQ